MIIRYLKIKASCKVINPVDMIFGAKPNTHKILTHINHQTTLLDLYYNPKSQTYSQIYEFPIRLFKHPPIGEAYFQPFVRQVLESEEREMKKDKKVSDSNSNLFPSWKSVWQIRSATSDKTEFKCKLCDAYFTYVKKDNTWSIFKYKNRHYHFQKKIEMLEVLNGIKDIMDKRNVNQENKNLEFILQRLEFSYKIEYQNKKITCMVIINSIQLDYFNRSNHCISFNEQLFRNATKLCINPYLLGAIMMQNDQGESFVVATVILVNKEKENVTKIFKWFAELVKFKECYLTLAYGHCDIPFLESIGYRVHINLKTKFFDLNLAKMHHQQKQDCIAMTIKQIPSEGEVLLKAVEATLNKTKSIGLLKLVQQNLNYICNWKKPHPEMKLLKFSNSDFSKIIIKQVKQVTDAYTCQKIIPIFERSLRIRIPQPHYLFNGLFRSSKLRQLNAQYPQSAMVFFLRSYMRSQMYKLESNKTNTFKVKHRFNENQFTLNRVEVKILKCECQMFESIGVACQHQIFIFKKVMFNETYENLIDKNRLNEF